MGGIRQNCVVIGVNSLNHIHYRYGLNDTWKHLPGILKNVTVSPLGVFGCNPSDQIYYLNGLNWQHLAGALKCISAGKEAVGGIRVDELTLLANLTKSFVIGVNSHDNIYLMTGIEFGKSLIHGWKQIAGKLKQISCLAGK